MGFGKRQFQGQQVALVGALKAEQKRQVNLINAEDWVPFLLRNSDILSKQARENRYRMSVWSKQE